MQVIYNFGILILGLAIRLSSLFNAKAKLWIEGRRNWRKHLPQIDSKKPLYWFHCASLGEFDQGLPMMFALKEHRPEAFILVTFFSPSGMQHFHKRKHPADYVCYLPLDTPSSTNFFIEYFKPKLVFFVKYEFWTNFLRACDRNKIPVFNLSGLFREDHRFFKWYGLFFRKTLRYLDHFFVQNETSATLLRGIGIDQVTISGDARYDRVMNNKATLVQQPLIERFTKGERVFIAGSTWPEDEALILPFINQTSQKVIIAPHNIDNKHIDLLCGKIERSFVKFSDLKMNSQVDSEILVLDSIGQLTSAYSFGEFAYVGGGFSGKLHNILEPAAFGLPIIIGPKYKRFPEAHTFVERGFAFSVSTPQALNIAVEQIQTKGDQINDKLLTFMHAQTGVSERVLEVLKVKRFI